MTTARHGTGAGGASVRGALSSRTEEDWRTMLRASFTRIATFILGAALVAGAFALTLALLTHDPRDAAFSTAAGAVTGNAMGPVGAHVADLLLLALGLPAGLLLPGMAVAGVELWRQGRVPAFGRRLAMTLAGLALAGLALELWTGGAADGLPAGRGGLVALLVGAPLSSALAALGGAQGAALGAAARFIVIILLAGLGLIWWWRALRLEPIRWPSWDRRAARDDAAVPTPTPAPSPFGNILARLRARVAPTHAPVAVEAGADADAAPAPAPASQAPPPRARAAPDQRQPPTIALPAAAPQLPSAPVSATPSPRQGDLLQSYALPPLALLTPAPPATGGAVDRAALERNARLLESVLEDFQVKGAITAVRPGPVVTMYELEPAPGTRALRVVNLADDIARNMSAQSARIATVQGRTVIGIELPNARREPVVLHEMIASQAFQDQAGGLPIILGKNIAGDPVIADLAPMPHLLIAGTTGSGKSVGLNTMILSLLYRLTPEECRMILIDPKMLELSVYDGIPHLLAPVVTEPKKAIRALKWAVEQMEDRYRMMSSLSVRNLASFNDKVRAAKAKGASLGRKVQTGHDPETGLPVYEEEALDYQPLPQVVVVVDELADLMMTAGKEVEFLIQRLAQKARAAGIHLILATQRPSVDVITGVIKANLPTRISFNVTSKIDSRTIIGDAGAEQLLGKGDMLYMSGGRQLTRVHGPFVSDDEVREVADHWRAQGEPAYVDAVTEEPEDGGFALDGAPVGEDSPEEQIYARARQVVIDSQKASTSWLQRQLRIGYNSAARLIERMEEEGLVSPPNHVGRRDVLVEGSAER